MVVEPVTVKLAAMVAEPPMVKLPVSLIYVAFNPANVVVAVFWVNAPCIVVDAPKVAAPRLEMLKNVEVAPVLTILKRSESWPLAERITRGIELTAVPAVEVASTVKTALVKGEVVPMANWSKVLSLKNRVREEIEETVL